MKHEIIKILEQAKNLIRTEQTWNTDWYETKCNQFGNVGYCASGAIHIAQNPNAERKDYHGWSKAHEIFNKVTRMMGYHNIAMLNDVAGHASVMTAFDLAIQLLRDDIIRVTP